MKSSHLLNDRSSMTSSAKSGAYGRVFVVPNFPGPAPVLHPCRPPLLPVKGERSLLATFTLDRFHGFSILLGVPAMQAPAFRRGQGYWGQRPQGLAFDLR